MKRMIFFFMFVLVCTFMSQAQNKIKSYILQIEGDKVYLDVTIPKVKVGDVLSVYTDAGYMIHPITKQQIKKEGEILADLEVVEVKERYSIATVFPELSISKLKAGMIASMPENVNNMPEFVNNTPEIPYEAPYIRKGEVTLHSGTIIPLQAVSYVRASKVKKGQDIDFRVAHDIIVDGELIIPAGTLAQGKVYEAKKSSWVGTKGRLGINIDFLSLPSGQRLPLTSANIYITGKNRTPLSVITALFFTPCLFICGSKAEMEAGYTINAMVANSVDIPIK